MDCENAYHYACLAACVTDSVAEIRPPWTCPVCIGPKPKSGNNDDTPVRFNPNVTTRPPKRQALQSPPSTHPESTPDEFQKFIQRALKEEIDGVVSRMEDSIRSMFVTELRAVRDEMGEVKESINFMNDKFEEILKQQAETKKEIADLKTQNNALKSTVKDLGERLNTMEQSARSSNVEIQCVPEKRNENLLSLVSQISTVINCNLTADSVSHVTRVAKLNPGNPRPRSIVAQFTSTKLRDQFMAAAINFNKGKKVEDKLNSAHVGFVEQRTTVFITEHLSPANKALHAAARSTAKKKGYKHVWVRGGRIFMRKSDDSDYIIVKNLDSLNNLN